MAKNTSKTEHHMATLTMHKVVKSVVTDTYDNTQQTLGHDETELVNITLRAATLDELKTKIASATALA